jgi:hypothetical protein
MFNSPAGPFSVNRPVEWILAACMIYWGVATFITPNTIDHGAFRYIGTVGLGISAIVFATFNLFVGVVWVAALIKNGAALQITAPIRWACALACSIVLAYMAICLAYLTKDTHTLSLGIGSHAAWGAGALYSCLRAGIDATASEVMDRSSNVTVAVFSDDDGSRPSADASGKLGPIPDIAIHDRSNNGDKLRRSDLVLAKGGRI